ncbi:UNC93-like protein like [Argiope bruennichi]|uniref:UNC93-like protein like n=1 Tax=Argiope bruennichi TaxID=94029 RepID=A0A8T0FT31_ARGBR|nr:UNC93-like protein like [Argiope bruennichi]
MDGTGINVFLADVAEVDLGQNPSINKDEKTDIQQDGVMDSKTLRWRSLRNLFIFNTCYVLTYTGFWALSNLQSTMNAAGGLGDYSQAVIYVFSMISSLFLPKLLIDKFGCKNILVVGSPLLLQYRIQHDPPVGRDDDRFCRFRTHKRTLRLFPNFLHR